MVTLRYVGGVVVPSRDGIIMDTDTPVKHHQRGGGHVDKWRSEAVHHPRLRPISQILIYSLGHVAPLSAPHLNAGTTTTGSDLNRRARDRGAKPNNKWGGEGSY